MDFYFVSYPEYKLLLKDCMSKFDFKEYDSIICPLRGGFNVANPFSRKLNLPIVYYNVSMYPENDTTVKDKPLITFAPKLNPELKYIIMDDIYDTGATIKWIKEYNSDCVIDAFVLFTKKNLKNLKYGKKVKPNTWVTFWWESI